MRQRRTIYEIYWEILVYCKQPRLFTQIVQRCDLNSKTCEEYLRFLLGKGCIEVADSQTYMATAKAREYLNLFEVLYEKLYEAPLQFRIKSDSLPTY